jgi:hypothetical protein
MITPYSARLLIRSIPNLGSGVGAISGLSTTGSIFGTLGTSFYLIQWIGTRNLIVMNGFILIGMGLLAILAQIVLKPHAVGQNVEEGSSSGKETSEPETVGA